MTPLRRRGLLALAALAAVSVLLLVYRPGYHKLQRMHATLAAAEAEHQRLEAEQARLTQQVDRLQRDPLELEREARQQIGLVRPGEVIYKFPQDDIP